MGFREFLSAASAKEMAGLAEAKAEMSARFLRPKEGARRPKERIRTEAYAARSPAEATPVQNVVGVGIDEKFTDGVPTGVLAVKFLVKRKFPRSTIFFKRELLPKLVHGYDTDVEEVGLIVPQAKHPAGGGGAGAGGGMPNPRDRFRAAQPGCSIGFADPNNSFRMAGTFGLVVKDSEGNRYLLSNNHVLAFESGVADDGVTTRVGLPAGAPIFQPGLPDGGNVARDVIARLTRWVDLRADQPNNTVDGAIAELTPQNVAIRDILFVGAPQGTAPAAKDMIVHKFGRTTSYRAGRVSSVTFDVTIPYLVGNVTFTDQIAIRGLNERRFSDSGDSGSAVLERGTGKVVGLLFAGATNGSLTFANHIADVLTAELA
jgi:hypothetical protein